ncbi:hypothetical protein EDB83DRAFT_892131 [Lactarius deliciosus]|nr:hypothetical protein EDB83DRAFT_892131 [Lactarius deliciosus]
MAPQAVLNHRRRHRPLMLPPQSSPRHQYLLPVCACCSCLQDPAYFWASGGTVGFDSFRNVLTLTAPYAADPTHPPLPKSPMDIDTATAGTSLVWHASAIRATMEAPQTIDCDGDHYLITTSTDRPHDCSLACAYYPILIKNNKTSATAPHVPSITQLPLWTTTRQ